MVDTTAQLNVYLEDKEVRASLRLACLHLFCAQYYPEMGFLGSTTRYGF